MENRKWDKDFHLLDTNSCLTWVNNDNLIGLILYFPTAN